MSVGARIYPGPTAGEDLARGLQFPGLGRDSDGRRSGSRRQARSAHKPLRIPALVVKRSGIAR